MSDPAHFQEIQDEYFRLRGQLAAGQLTQEQFRNALRKLMIQDAQGRWWTPAEADGSWQVYDGKSWILATPPVQATPSPVSPNAPPGAPGPKRSHSWLLLGGGIGCALLACCGLLVLVLASSPTATPSPMAQVPPTGQISTLSAPTSSPPTPVPPTGQLLTPPFTSTKATGVPTAGPTSGLELLKIPQGNHVLSQDQQIVWSMFGAPSFFVLNLAPDDAVDPVQANDYQTWYYPKRGVSYAFVNGTYAGSDDIGPVADAAAYPSVHPLQFRKGMSLAEVQSTLGETPVGQFPVPGSILNSTQFYKFKGIHAAFQQGGLVYIETAPYLPFAANQPKLGLSEPRPVSPLPVRFAPADQGRGTVALAHPQLGGKVGFAKWLLKFISEAWSAKGKVETTGRQFSYDDIEEQVKDAAEAARAQANQMLQDAKTESDPTKAALLQQAAAAGNKLANSLVTDLLPELQSAIRNEKVKDGIGWVLPPLPGAPEGNARRVKDLLNEMLRDKNLRPGEVRSDIRDWLESLSTNWESLSPELRASLALDILETKIKERCGDPRTQERTKYDECYWTTLNWLAGEIKNWLGWKDCDKALREIRNRPGSQLAPPAPFTQLASLRPFPPLMPAMAAQAQSGQCPGRVSSPASSTPTVPPIPNLCTFMPAGGTGGDASSPTDSCTKWYNNEYVEIDRDYAGRSTASALADCLKKNPALALGDRGCKGSGPETSLEVVYFARGCYYVSVTSSGRDSNAVRAKRALDLAGQIDARLKTAPPCAGAFSPATATPTRRP